MQILSKKYLSPVSSILLLYNILTFATVFKVKMNSKSLLLLSVIVLFFSITSCQEDIPLLGQDGTVVDYDSAFLSSITLNGYDTLDPSGNYWDTTAVFFPDTANNRFPDVFYNIDIYDSSFLFSYFQDSHFDDVLPSELPLTYNINPPVYIPAFYKYFYLRTYDFEIDTPTVDSTFMDSILFVVGPDTVSAVKYPTSFTNNGTNGVNVSVGITWK